MGGFNEKHTPGPWEVSFSQINAGKHYCIVQFGFNIRENPQAYANARLIAAAPELLAVLEEAVESNMVVESSEWWGRVSAALAKATGA